MSRLMLVRMLLGVATGLTPLFTGCAHAEIAYAYVNDADTNLLAEGTVIAPRSLTTIKVGPGSLQRPPANWVGLSRFSGYHFIPTTLTLRWRTEAESRAATPDSPKFLHEQVIDLDSLVDRKTFQGTIWLRFDGKSWLAWPQTKEEHEEHQKYTDFPAAPWQCRLVSVPNTQWKLLKEQPWLGRLTIFNPNPKPADAGKLIRKTDNL